MARETDVLKGIKELNEEFAILKLKTALLSQQEEELTLLEQAGKQDALLQDLISQGESRIIRRIRHCTRIHHFRVFGTEFIPAVAKVAAGALLVCYIGLTVAVAGNATVRTKLMEFMMNIEEQYVEFGFTDAGSYVDVPEEWEGYYYPTYIPDGFVINHASRFNVSFEDSSGNQLYFQEYGPTANSVIDSEDAELRFIDINGQSALLVNKSTWTSVVWSIDQRVIVLEYNSASQNSQNEIIQIADSVRMIR